MSRARLAFVVLPFLALVAGFALAQDVGYQPTPFEQYLLELVNRARADPDAEAAFFGIDLNEGLDPGTIPSGPRPPLAFHTVMIKAARDHTQDILDNMDDLPADHTGSDGRTLTQRIGDLGIAWNHIGENNSWSSQGGKALKLATVDRLHLLLFKDFTSSFEVPGRGHRKLLLSFDYNQVGIGVLHGGLGDRVVGICTEDFLGYGGPFITGVVYSDWVDGNGFYTPGEGFWGALVEAELQSAKSAFNPTYSTWTFDSGGYTLPVPGGTYDMTVYLPGGGTVQQNGVVVSGTNVKVDLTAAPSVIPPPLPEFSLLAGAAKAAKGGGWTVALKKALFRPGSWGLTDEQADSLYVTLDGFQLFPPGERALSKVKKGLNADGDVVKFGIADPNKNKLTMDFAKGTFKLAVKSLPGLALVNGAELEVKVMWSGGEATLLAPIELVGTKGTLKPATGEVGLD